MEARCCWGVYTVRVGLEERQVVQREGSKSGLVGATPQGSSRLTRGQLAASGGGSHPLWRPLKGCGMRQDTFFCSSSPFSYCSGRY